MWKPGFLLAIWALAFHWQLPEAYTDRGLSSGVDITGPWNYHTLPIFEYMLEGSNTSKCTYANFEWFTWFTLQHALFGLVRYWLLYQRESWLIGRDLLQLGDISKFVQRLPALPANMHDLVDLIDTDRLLQHTLLQFWSVTYILPWQAHVTTNVHSEK